MRITYLVVAITAIAVLTGGCAGDSAPQLEPPSPVPSIVTGGTQAAPTRDPRSTPIPWWGGTIPLQTSERQLAAKPTDLTTASDGSIYLADAELHTIVHLDTRGNLLGQWGSYSGTDQALAAPKGTFNEPWGIAVAPEGSVYVADTWNHRIQAFAPAGEFLRSWGEPGQGAEPYGLFGPRDVAVGNNGFVYVSDTGNKRIVVYTPEGQYVAQIGREGDRPGQFIEPVGIALSEGGDLYVADEGNRRVQVLSIDENGNLSPKDAWPVSAWQHNDMLYKPYLCVVGARVFVTDTESGSVLEYTTAGELRATYDLNSTGYLNYGLVYGIAAQNDGTLWVSDIAGGAPVLVMIVPAL